jgi:hypothetical protein
MQHDKAIEQAKNRARKALQAARKCLSDEDFKRIWDSLKMWGVDLAHKVWNWLNNDPRQNWPSIYGPKPVLLPLPVPVPVPVLP